MSSWIVRIKQRMKELPITQEILARKMGITRGAITHYLAGRRTPSLRQFQKLAAVLKTDPAWLQFGIADGNKPNSQKLKEPKLSKPSSHSIPLASWEQVSEFVTPAKIPLANIQNYVQHFFATQSHWYALQIKCDAMTAPLGNSKSFHAGDVIIIDPEKNVAHGNFVVAILPNSKEATFKQYVVDGGVRYLKPLNPQYPITAIDDSTHICGVVVAHLSLF